MVLPGLCYLLLALVGVLGLGFGALLSLGVFGPGELLLLRLAGGVGAGALLLGAALRGAGPGLWAGLGGAVAPGAIVVLIVRE